MLAGWYEFMRSTSCVPPIITQRYERYETIRAYNSSTPAIRGANSIPPHAYTDASLSACGRWHIIGLKRFDGGFCAFYMCTDRSNSRFPHVSDHSQLCFILLRIRIRICKLRLLCIFAITQNEALGTLDCFGDFPLAAVRGAAGLNIDMYALA
jgi:hypothetical protein